MKYAGYRLHIYSGKSISHRAVNPAEIVATGAMLLIMGGALALLLAPRVKGSLACLYALHSFVSSPSRISE